jgi:hypothetical protein
MRGCGGRDQAHVLGLVLAIDEFCGEERLAQHTQLKLACFGLADDDVAAVKGEWSASWVAVGEGRQWRLRRPLPDDVSLRPGQ